MPKSSSQSDPAPLVGEASRLSRRPSPSHSGSASKKIAVIAWREFRATALTRAFFVGAVVLPALIWGAMFGVGAMNFRRPPMEGTLAVLDATRDSVVASGLEAHFSPEAAAERSRREREALERIAKEQALQFGVPEDEVEQRLAMASLAEPAPRVTLERLPADADMQAQRGRARAGEVLAVVSVTEDTLTLVPQGAPPPGEGAAPDPRGSYQFIQGETLRPEHARTLRRSVERVIEDERFRRAGMDPVAVRAVSNARTEADAVLVTREGEKKSNDALVRILPFIFLMLIFMGSMTGGQYLMMGTLEEKGSRVMEVILSACSVRELLLGKLIGQGLVGLALMAVYAGVGLAAARNFNVLSQIPAGVLPWTVVYYLMAYAFLGAMMLAVGSAVTEIREAQALYAPIMLLTFMPFLLMFPLLENPGSWIATAASFFPPTTPFAMVMRLSQPSYQVPLWELVGSTIAGFLGVVAMIWIAAKVFRVGVLMYGKPPTLLGLLKWIRYA